jgi:hypothetical protein
MSERWIARIGLCAVAAVIAACLGVLFLQNRGDTSALRTLEPAQIQSTHSLGTSMLPADSDSAHT